MLLRYEIRFPICGYEDHYFERMMILKYDNLEAAKKEFEYLTRIAMYKDRGHGWLKEEHQIDGWIGNMPVDTHDPQERRHLPKCYEIREQEINPEKFS